METTVSLVTRKAYKLYARREKQPLLSAMDPSTSPPIIAFVIYLTNLAIIVMAKHFNALFISSLAYHGFSNNYAHQGIVLPRPTLQMNSH